ncbi:MAG: hypothetical protein Crog4KO_31840 [Crocinitomicaceae bacterium]
MLHCRWDLFVLCYIGLSFSGLSQGDRIFIDYSACTKGLIATNGDTVIPPNYENLYAIRNRYYKKYGPVFYQLESGNERALVNSNFQQVIGLGEWYWSFQSDSILLARNLAGDQRLLHGLRPENNSRVFDTIYPNTPKYGFYTCYKNDSCFLLNPSLQTIIQDDYTSIKPTIDFTKNFTGIPDLLEVQRNGKNGVIDYQNQTILETKYDRINYPYIRFGACLRREDLHFGAVRETAIGFESALISFNGDTIAPFTDGVVSSLTYQGEKDSSVIIPYVYSWNDGDIRLSIPGTNQSTAPFDRTYSHRNYHLAFRNDNSYLLDTNLNILDSISNQYYVFGRNNYQRQHSSNTWPYEAPYIVVTDKFKGYKGRRFTHKKPYKQRYDLRDMRLNKKVIEDYNNILTMEHDGATFFHCWEHNNLNPKRRKKVRRSTSRLDIYDSSYTKIFSTEIEGVHPYNYSHRPYVVNDLLIIKGSENRVGAIRNDGGAFLPFEYDHIELRRRTFLENQVRSLETMLFVSKNDLCGIVDLEGKELLPCKYRKINISQQYITATTEDSIFYYHSTDSLIRAQEIVKSIAPSPIKKAKIKRRSTKKPKRKKKSPVKKRNSPKYFIKRGIAYVKVDDSIYKYHDYRAYHNEPFSKFKKYVINRNSEVVYKIGKRYLEVYTHSPNVFYFVDEDKLVILDSLGNNDVFDIEFEPYFENQAHLLIFNHQRERRSSVFDLEKAAWLFENEAVFTEKERWNTLIRGTEDEMYVYDLKGRLKYDSVINGYDFFEYHDDFIVFEFKNPRRYTILDTNFNSIRPISEGFVSTTHNANILIIEDTQDNCEYWSMKRNLFLPCDHLLRIQNSSNLIFSKTVDSLAFYDAELNILEPLNSVYEIMKYKSIAELYGLANDTLFTNHIILSEKFTEEERFKYGNLIAWELIKHRYPRPWMPYNGVKLKYRMNRDGEKELSQRIILNIVPRKTTYSKMGNLIVSQKFVDSTSLRYYSNEIYSGVYTKYLLPTDSFLVEISKNDFLQDGTKLRKLLLKGLNEEQALGLRCGNIEEELNHLESNFELEQGGIRFYGLRNKYNLYLHYYDLVGIWVSPYSFSRSDLLDESP